MAKVNDQLEDDLDDYFIKVFTESKQKVQKVSVELGICELEITDFNMRKIIETLVSDWP